MFISIITPSYNNCNFIKGCIESINFQKYKDVEHIIVDGGSIDGTIDLLEVHHSDNWISESDNGMYDAVNKGIHMASGDIISYLNCDDRYFAYTLETIVRVFQKYPDLDFVYGYCTYVNVNDEVKYILRSVPFLPGIQKYGRITWTQPTCFWRKRVHGKIGLFDISFKTVGDWDFFQRMMIGGLKGMCIKKPLAKFMLRDDCISETMSEILKKEVGIIYNKYYLGQNRLPYILNEAIFAILNSYNIVARYRWKSRDK